ncbi:tetraacyldisaccharide 4'-kinase [Paraferrimonas sedimenticola]|uniref:Tetraacyldisaccharide 4'-kinase n=1 Tax=Paraferrimonas sedimenticola TaxID=375674 RepID=A0AA37RTA7_9GAMM|nr:tetraacyldisaccharide 4'-kinase [Paraferrimonas sedimenticola]GLP94879.1 tetraacyldisaccharide 4'-kinase [Paraferrimonas sedimenticola]
MRLIERTWYQGGALQWLLWPLSILFSGIALLRRISFGLGLLKSTRVSVPVVVVGNIGVGGAGKTPTVLALIKHCKGLGLRPGVISRGYGGSYDSKVHWVQDNDSAELVGDEPKLIQRRSGVPVVLAKARADAAQALADGGQVDVILTDDGLQHYALARDIELVVVDGVRRFGNGLRLPAGPLREGLARLKEVDAIICNGGTAQPNEFQMRLVPSPLQPMLDSLPDKPTAPIAAFAAIANPQRFFDTLEAQGFSLSESQGLKDHQSLDLDVFQSALDRGLAIVMTEKDAVKCDQIDWPQGAQVYFLPVDAELPQQFFQRFEQKLRKHIDGF